MLIATSVCGCSSVSHDKLPKYPTPTQQNDAIASLRKEYGLPALAVAEFKDGKIGVFCFCRCSEARRIPTPVQSTDKFHLDNVGKQHPPDGHQPIREDRSVSLYWI